MLANQRLVCRCPLRPREFVIRACQAVVAGSLSNSAFITIGDLSPLSLMTQLRFLRLYANQIADIDP